MQTSKIYNIDKVQQLIDLNGERVNFYVNFIVTSENPDSEFEVVVLNQSQLDSEDLNKLEYKKVKGKISGNVKSDQGIYQNYFLSIKSDTPTKVTVDLQFSEVAEKSVDSNKQTIETPPAKSSFFSRKFFIILIALIILGGVLYYFFYYKKNTNSVNYKVESNKPEFNICEQLSDNTPSQPIKNETKSPDISLKSSQSVDLPKLETPTPAPKSLLDRLKAVNINN